VQELLFTLQMSLVDQRPQELIAAAIMGVRVQYAAGLGLEGNCSSLRFSVDSVQVDDQMPGTRYPRFPHYHLQDCNRTLMQYHNV